MKRLIYILLSLLILTTGCREVPIVELEKDDGDSLKENMINANRYIMQGEDAQIDAYIQRRGWQMERLLGGARVMKTGEGGGKTLDYDETAVIEYSVETLGGNIIYEHVTDTVTIGRLEPTRGVDAALRTMSRGDKAIVILPSDQAYGVLGDGNRIGSRIVLVYKLKVNS